MNAKLNKLVERRGRLISRAASQRVALTEALAPWHTPLTIVDQGLSVVRYLRQHPLLLGGMLASALVMRPKRMIGLLRSGWFIWRAFVTIRHKL